jgi:hypothetical protein
MPLCKKCTFDVSIRNTCAVCITKAACCTFCPMPRKERNRTRQSIGSNPSMKEICRKGRSISTRLQQKTITQIFYYIEHYTKKCQSHLLAVSARHFIWIKSGPAQFQTCQQFKISSHRQTQQFFLLNLYNQCCGSGFIEFVSGSSISSETLTEFRVLMTKT